MSAPANDAPFSLREIVRDATRSLRADVGLHALWMLIFVSVAGVSCCGIGAVASGGIAVAGRGEGTFWVVALMYLVLPPLMLALYAIQQAVTMELVRARARSEPTSIGAATRRGLSRTPALVAHVLLRTIVEGSAIGLIYGLVFAVAYGTLERGTDGRMSGLGPIFWTLAVVGWLAAIVVAFAFRARYGLAFPAIVDGTGPWDAFGRSLELLSGRRWQFVRFRVFVLASWVLAYAVCMTPMLVSTLLPSDSGLRLALTLVGAVLVLAFYGLAYVLTVFDAAVEETFYLRVTRGLDTAELARTFE